MNMVNNSYKIIGHNIFSYDDLKNLSEIYGNRFYIFLPEIIQKNYTELKNAFSQYFNTEVLYSVKTNYTPHLLKIFCDMGVNPEVVSELEVDIINKIGLKTDRLIVNGPIKTKNLINSLEKYPNSIINIDSLNDLNLLQNFGNIGIRCNFPAKLMDGNRSRFGIDIESNEFTICLNELKRLNKKFGLHVHLPTRSLQSFKERSLYLKEIILSKKLELEFINLGGGMMSPMSQNMANSLNISRTSYLDYAKVIHDILGPISTLFKNKLILEPGTAIVANAFMYITKIKDIKSISKKWIAQLYGSTFDIFGTKRNVKVPIKIISSNDQSKTIEISRIVGYTCIENDEFELTENKFLSLDSFIQIDNIGSYSIQMKPPFINYSPPLIMYDKGEFSLIKEKENINSLLKDYIF